MTLTKDAQQVCNRRYFQKDKNGNTVEDWPDLVTRVVNHVCQNEKDEFKKEAYYLLLNTEFLPNSPCLVNAGTSSKSNGLLACQPGWVRINTDRGLIQLKDLVENTDIINIPTHTGVAKITKRWKNGVKNVLQIETEKGYRLFVTGDHRVYTIKNYNSLTQKSKKYLETQCHWERADNLHEGDALVLDFSEKPFPNKYVYKNKIKIDEDLARILAFAKCDGHLKYHQSGLKKHNQMVLVFEIIVDSEESLNLVTSSSHIKGNIIDIDNSKNNPYLKKIRAYGEKYAYLFDFGEFDSLNCDVPDEIFRSPQKVVAEFCKAVFDCEGTLSFSLSAKTGKKTGHVAIGMISESFIRDLQKLLNLFGIQSSISGPIHDKRTDCDRNPMYYLSITNTVHLKKFQKHIGFISSKKNRMLGDYLESIIDKNYDKFAFVIKSIKDIGEHEVYDISTSNETYLSEGIVVHNCFVTMPPEDCWSGKEDNQIGMVENIANFGHVARQGGGCGVDFSYIRPEGDPVFGSTHAKACGPIEHLRMISEVMSSITQSGFRGMAMLGALRIDHPDIEKFIVCKQRERALKTMLKEDIFNHFEVLEKEAHDHLNIVLDKFIHNFNISVFATDNFMKKVENNEEIELTFNAKSYKTIKARKLFNMIVQNAWKNGDPGMLFYDTINAGPYKYSKQEITATNPCGEMPLPAWGSCNLGSIDVSKFYNDKKHCYEWSRLRNAIETSIQFLDNVIDVNKFPTIDFAKWAKENRPVGLGIMGWADLLLKMKLTYGNDDSLKFAHKLGSFFQKIAHNKSVILGKERGTPKACKYKELDYRRNITTLTIAPTGTISIIAGCSSSIEPIFNATTHRYDNTGYKEIKHPMARKTYFRCASDLSWKEHINMQAAFQPYIDAAISKCITGNSLVLTENGWIRIKDLSDNRQDDTFVPLEINVHDGKTWKQTQDFYYGGRKKTIKITTKNGFVIEGTPNHKIKTFDSDGTMQFTRLDELHVGKYCPILFNLRVFGNVINLPEITFSRFKQSKHIKIPTTLNEELAYLLGVITAEGNYQANDSLVITHCDQNILSELNDIFASQFGIIGKISLFDLSDTRTDSVYRLIVNSRNLVKWMKDVADIRRGASNKIIPTIILSTTQNNIAAFLSGLFFNGYLTQSQYQKIKFGLCLDSESVIRDLQVILCNFGIASNVVRKYNNEYNKYFHEILIYGDSLFKLRNLINLRENHKQHILDNINIVKPNNYHLGLPKFITKIISESMSESISKSKHSMNGFINKHQNYRVKSAIYRENSLKQRDVEDALEYFGKTPASDQVLKTLSQYKNCIYQEIVKVEESEAEVFDIYVPDGNAFVANGLINHNTINFPNEATEKDIADAYMFAWKSGCFEAGSYIYTYDGYKFIEDIRKGDMVIGKDGMPHRVSEVFDLPFEKRRFITLHISGAEDIRSTSEHPILIAELDESENKLKWDERSKKIAWKNAQDVQIGDHVLIPRFSQKPKNNLSSLNVSDYLDSNTITGNDNLLYPSRVLPWGEKEVIAANSNGIVNKQIIDEDFVRFVGWFVAEGHFQGLSAVRMTFGMHEQDIAMELGEIIERKFALTPEYSIIESTGVSFRLEVRSKLFSEFLQKLIGKESINKHLPSWFAQLDLNLLDILINSHFAGDSGVTISNLLATQLFHARILLDQKAYFQNNYGEGFRVSENTSSKATMAKSLSYNECPYYCYRVFKTSSEVKESKVFNFAVEDNNSYLVNGIAVHNCKGITIYRDGSKTTQVLNTSSRPVVGANHAKPRPKEVMADIFKTRADGIDWHVIVGKLGETPYEVFAINGKQDLPKSGKVIKRKRRHYTLIDENDNVLIENIGEEENQIHTKIGLETRRFSLELRHNIDPKFIVETIDKSNDVITSFSKAVSRIMKSKYVSMAALAEITDVSCPDCARNGKQIEMIAEAGCWKCPVCYYSRCG